MSLAFKKAVGAFWTIQEVTCVTTLQKCLTSRLHAAYYTTFVGETAIPTPPPSIIPPNVMNDIHDDTPSNDVDGEETRNSLLQNFI